MRKRGLLVAAPASGCGKTTITLGLLRALRNQGTRIAAAKSGPDYIDPGFHQAAAGQESVNLDGWAMPPDRLRQIAQDQPGDWLLVEGAMGLFDGAADGSGSAAAVARALEIPALLVMDVRRQGQTAAVLARGLEAHWPGLGLPGVILNGIGSARHETLLRRAFSDNGIEVFGAVPRLEEIALPSRHLGLVQALEIHKLEEKLERLAGLVSAHIDLSRIEAAAMPIAKPSGPARRCPAPAARIAIARDAAFAFSYPHMLADWKKQGCALSFFSPLDDEGPDEDCDAVFLPGGYPELFAGQLAAAGKFRCQMELAARKLKTIYGECGGYMVLGQTLVDAAGTRHRMLGLLPHGTDFQARRRHLGYREVVGENGQCWRAHEFHYASLEGSEGCRPLWHSPEGFAFGHVSGNVSGSFIHLIQPVERKEP